jgi:hypothetical protein
MFAIPVIHDKDTVREPRTDTTQYFADGRAFGTPAAKPALTQRGSVGRHLDWNDEQIEAAAVAGMRNGDDLGSAAVEMVCRRTLELLDGDKARDSELATLRIQVEHLGRELAAEQTAHQAARAESARLLELQATVCRMLTGGAP